MEKLNLLVLSDDLDLRIEIKNLATDEEFAISGYSGFTAEGKRKAVKTDILMKLGLGAMATMFPLVA